MTTACHEHYIRLHSSTAEVLTLSFADANSVAMAKGHSFVDDLGLWLAELSDHSAGRVLKAVAREYQFALLALSFGQYRAAFSGLRLTLELGFSAIHYSANERELREWARGERDASWSALVDRENGILSKRFVRLFSPALAEEASQYLGFATAIYRECSEYVHGNSAINDLLPEKVVFDQAQFDAWHQKASGVRLCLLFVLASRFSTDFAGPARNRLESMLTEHLGHSVGIRALLGASVDG